MKIRSKVFMIIIDRDRMLLVSLSTCVREHGN